MSLKNAQACVLRVRPGRAGCRAPRAAGRGHTTHAACPDRQTADAAPCSTSREPGGGARGH
eukprot:6563310-Prymnesium_polylepis.1